MQPWYVVTFIENSQRETFPSLKNYAMWQYRTNLQAQLQIHYTRALFITNTCLYNAKYLSPQSTTFQTLPKGKT